MRSAVMSTVAHPWRGPWTNQLCSIASGMALAAASAAAVVMAADSAEVKSTLARAGGGCCGCCGCPAALPLAPRSEPCAWRCGEAPSVDACCTVGGEATAFRAAVMARASSLCCAEILACVGNA